MTTTSARSLLDHVLDHDSFHSWDSPPHYGDIDEDYRLALARARERSGVDEAVITGQGTVDGTPVAFILSEFAFLGGSIGAATSRRIIEAIHRATREKLPLLISPCSGGTRMQEGTPAFALMISITTAVYRHKDAHLPYLVYLRNPTMGGVLASWGSTGHFTFAEPEALIGFLGPRVVELTTGHPMPEGVQTGENLVRHGIIDGVVSPTQLREAVRRVTGVLRRASTSVPRPLTPAHPRRSAWESIEKTREDGRIGARDLIRGLPRVGLSGTPAAVNAALSNIGGRPVVLIAQDRRTQPLGPAALHLARRGIALAVELRLPIVSIIDTPGAELSRSAEEQGLAGSIARTMGELVDAPVPTMSIILGQGCGGAALAMLPADRVLATENAWMSPLPPEGASAIIHRDTSHAAEMMEQQGVTALAMRESGIIDGIIAETEDPGKEIIAAIEHTLQELDENSGSVGREQRFRRYERLAETIT
ncbi:carboxyl transferase domain-containing protein [Corynebacterium pacaense]|uniref:carboxyl transferase domain-containing protein n=1 Tax=Corynebacterium pacaense TaxID=1816684 RepID=UPI0009BAE441|nr:carboxyl transferase domain-containing protein [Corynebacterium pacaense]